MKKHDKLFKQYVEELKTAKQKAEGWWQTLVDSEINEDRDRNGAEAAVRGRWPFGPTSHPWIIAVYRKYYLLCRQLNEQDDEPPQDATSLTTVTEDWGREEDEKEEGFIEPKVFVLDLLAGEETNDLYKFMLSMAFIPIGLKNNHPA